jgi:DNA-binding NarL/FixJ family response regulator
MHDLRVGGGKAFHPFSYGGLEMSVPAFLIVDDHPLFLEALQSALHANYPDSDVEVASSISGARAKLNERSFNLVLLDLKMPDAGGLDGLRSVRATCPKTPLAVISAFGGNDIVSQVRSCGADGFISKNLARQDIMSSVNGLLLGHMQFPSVVPEAPMARLAGDDLIEKLRQLTPQQLKVLNRVCEAKLNKQIAYELGVTETTVKAHITLIFKKLCVHSRTQAVLLLQKMRHELEGTEFAMLLSAQT